METRIPRFDLGQTIITREALRLLRQEEVIAAPGSNVVGDLGDLSPSLRAGNERAIEEPGPVVSVHESRAASTRCHRRRPLADDRLPPRGEGVTTRRPDPREWVR